MKKRVKIGVGLAIWVLILIFLAASAGLVLMIGNRPEEDVGEVVEERTVVRVIRTEPQDVVDIVRIPATIEAYRSLQLAAESNGRIVEVNFDKGDEVSAGQVLLKIDDSIWESMRRKAEVQLNDAERDMERYVELEQSGAVSRYDFENIELRRDVAAADLERAQAELQHCTLKAPISGVINDRLVELGEYASEGDAMFELLEIDQVKISMRVPEAHILAAASAERMAFAVDVFPGQTFTGRVDFVASKSAGQSNSFPVELLHDNRDRQFKAGMIATVQLPGKTMRGAVVLPLSAVIAEEGEHIVYIVDGERAERRVVTLSAMLDREAVIEKGVSPGELVVVDGHRGLSDGRLISVAE